MFFRRFFSKIKILEFDLNAAEKSSEIMADLLTTGRPVTTLNVLIAGIAIANGAGKIATRDKDFMEISKYPDWKLCSTDERPGVRLKLS
jgi:predicted nucleic acid-binding protein